jgi:hypothetical protein
MLKTLYVLGAGSSKEVDLPVGEQLTEAIANLVDIRFEGGYRRISGDEYIHQALRIHMQRIAPNNADINPHLHAGWRMRDAMPLAASIDNFIDAHRADKLTELIGKLAIVRAILAAERRSKLWRDATDGGPDKQLDLDNVRDSWFAAFWRVLCNGCTAGEFAKRAKSVAFVSFNYDRCIQQFLYHAARAYYGLQSAEAAAAVSHIKVFHPYGSVGQLPWHQDAAASAVAYGEDVQPGELLSLTAGIRTFTESIEADEDGVITGAREWIDSANRIVFLGFAYHSQNMRLLWPTPVGERKVAARNVYGTAYKISDSDIRAIEREISAYSGIDATGVSLGPNLTCSDLFHEYQVSLSMMPRR